MVIGWLHGNNSRYCRYVGGGGAIIVIYIYYMVSDRLAAINRTAAP